MIAKGEENEAVEAIEFWSSICDEESARQDDLVNHCQYISGASKILVPYLAQAATKIPDNKGDENDRKSDISTAASTCICNFDRGRYPSIYHSIFTRKSETHKSKKSRRRSYLSWYYINSQLTHPRWHPRRPTTPFIHLSNHSSNNRTLQ